MKVLKIHENISKKQNAKINWISSQFANSHYSGHQQAVIKILGVFVKNFCILLSLAKEILVKLNKLKRKTKEFTVTIFKSVQNAFYNIFLTQCDQYYGMNGVK